MGGERITVAQCVARVLTGRLRIDDPLQIGTNAYIVLDDVSVAFNHTCDPNALIRGENEMIARRDITAGEEITFDYAATVLPTFYTRVWHMRCACGSAACRGAIADVRTIPDDILRAYLGSGGVQDFVRMYLGRRRADLFGAIGDAPMPNAKGGKPV